MGKRELLIIVAFAVVGVVAWQLTAAPAKEGQSISFSNIFGRARKQMQSEQAVATHTATGTLSVSASVMELHVAGVLRGVQVIGEDRRDIAYELTVESSGPDPATALKYAAKTRLKPDDLGTTLNLAVDYPNEARQWAGMTLKVPSRLAVRLEGGSGARVSNVAALELDRVGGLVTAENVAGKVRGTQSNSELTISGAGSADLTVASSRVRLTKIAHGVTINSRSGRCEVSESQGVVEIDETSTDVSITNHGGMIKVTGTGGRVTIDNPRQSVSVNVRRAPITIALRSGTPMTIVASEERVRVSVEGASVVVDAVSSGGHIDASDFGLKPEGADQEQRLTHTFGAANAPRASIRNTRGDIVIAKSK